MKNWKTKLFGDNTMNFYGWLFAGLLVCGASAWLVVQAILTTDTWSAEQFFLLAIYLMFVGQFGVAWHNYLVRVAETLDAQKNKNTDARAG